MTEESVNCPICDTLANFRCSGCAKVQYCSREHQKQHWKVHKSECCAWKIGQDEKLGRHLLASRDIKAGEIILQEKPLLLTPPRITPPICLGCCREFESTDENEQQNNEDSLDVWEADKIQSKPCPKGCGWPLCASKSCQNSVDHEPECKIALDRGGVNIRFVQCDHPMYQAVGIFRAIALKENNPKAFEAFMKLEAHTKERKELNEQREKALEVENKPLTESATVNIISKFFKRPDIDEETAIKILGIIEVNGHEIPIPDEFGHGKKRIIGIYENSSLLEHQCLSNCVKTWNTDTKEIIIRAALPIKKGEHLSISYLDPLWCTQDRLNFLKLAKYFTCKCARCSDPTELGCHISSIRCQSSKCIKFESKYMKDESFAMVCIEDPYNPTKSNWKCNSCGEIYSPSYVVNVLSTAAKEMGQVQSTTYDKRIDADEAFLKKFHKTLSWNHYFCLEIKVELAQLYGRTQEEPLAIMAPRKLARKIALCEDLLKVLNVIMPGYQRLRGLILYELQASVATLSKLRKLAGDMSLEMHIVELKKCGIWLAEVVKVLGWEPENSIERRRGDGAKDEFIALKKLLLRCEEELARRAEEENEAENRVEPDELGESYIEELL